MAGSIKVGLKDKATKLRRKGLTYSEILKEVPVAKSTLSLWLRDVGLSKRQIQKITERKIRAAHKGGEVRKRARLFLSKKIKEEAAKEISNISKRELWLIGIMLYWAEGSKEKENSPGSGTQFTNSDPYMIRLFIKWLIDICRINRNDIILELYIHENHRNNVPRAVNHWAKFTEFPESSFQHIYFKKGNPKTKRKNIEDSYYGIVRIKVKSSSILNRKIAGWVNGVINCCR